MPLPPSPSLALKADQRWKWRKMKWKFIFNRILKNGGERKRNERKDFVVRRTPGSGDGGGMTGWGRIYCDLHSGGEFVHSEHWTVNVQSVNCFIIRKMPKTIRFDYVERWACGCVSKKRRNKINSTIKMLKVATATAAVCRETTKCVYIMNKHL